MIYTFTETEKQQIESCGITTVQFELLLKNAREAVDSLTVILDFITEALKDLFKTFSLFIETVDDVRFKIETICDSADYNTSERYKIVKILSKVSGFGMKEVWKMTRHTRLARSCC